jgi:hypothetical protein
VGEKSGSVVVAATAVVAAADVEDPPASVVDGAGIADVLGRSTGVVAGSAVCGTEVGSTTVPVDAGASVVGVTGSVVLLAATLVVGPAVEEVAVVEVVSVAVVGRTTTVSGSVVDTFVGSAETKSVVVGPSGAGLVACAAAAAIITRTEKTAARNAIFEPGRGLERPLMFCRSKFMPTEPPSLAEQTVAEC